MGDDDIEVGSRLTGQDERVAPLVVGRTLPGVNTAAVAQDPDRGAS